MASTRGSFDPQFEEFMQEMEYSVSQLERIKNDPSYETACVLIKAALEAVKSECLQQQSPKAYITRLNKCIKALEAHYTGVLDERSVEDSALVKAAKVKFAECEQMFEKAMAKK